MYKIIRDNRQQIENEFLALLLNKPELFLITQIKYNYLANKNNQKIFKYCKECYDEFGLINLVKILEKHKDLDVDYLVSLMDDVFYFPSAWKEQLKLAEESIIKFFKEDIIKILNDKLKNNQMSYDEFMSKMKELDNITLLENSIELTEKEILDSINEEHAKIYLNKFSKLNNLLKLVQGDFLVIGATTGAGKSGFMINLMADLMSGYQCIYFNMEMSKSTIYKRIVSVIADIKVNDVEKPQTDYQKRIISVALQKIEKAKIIVEHKANDMTGIKATISKMKDKSRHTIVFIDHLGLVKIDGSRSLYEQATEVAKELRQICLEYDCTIISASQLNRGAYSSEEITLNMLKDSGELENSASKVILLYKAKDAKKEDLMQEMVFDIAKNRDGYTGVVNAIYDKAKQIFIED